MATAAYTRGLAEFICNTSSASILRDAKLVKQGKHMILNGLAVSISASVSSHFSSLLKWAESEGAAPKCTVIGNQMRTSPTIAATLNGWTLHFQDYDDTHFPSVIHPTAPVLPAVLALAETNNSTQEDVLVSFILGAEVACRVSMSIHPWHYDDGWHITSSAGVFGAAAGAARILGLDVEETCQALGVAGTQAFGVRQVFGSDTKPLHPASAARVGVHAVQLVKYGFTGPSDILEGRRGFWKVYSQRGTQPDALLKDAGSTWELHNVGLKAYANGIVSQPIQDAVIALRNQHNLTPDEVTAIKIRSHPLVRELMGVHPDPKVGLQGKFSYHHCAAAALVDGAGHDAQFSDARVRDPVIAKIRTLVDAEDGNVREDEVFVNIKCKDGRDLSIHIEHATGTPLNPMSEEFLWNKFNDLVSPVLGESRSKAVWDKVGGLDCSESVEEITELLVTGGKAKL